MTVLHHDDRYERRDAGVEREEVEEVTADPHAARRARARRVQQWIWLVAGILETLLAFRFVLMLFGANRSADFAAMMYAVTEPFVLPFLGIFPAPTADGSVMEPHTLLAMIVYALVAWLIATIAWLILADTRSGRTTTRYESHTETRR